MIDADGLRLVYTVSHRLVCSDAAVVEVGRGLNVRGSLYCPKSSKAIGHFRRRIVLNDDGWWHANHQEFFVDDPAYRGRGIARLMYSRSVGYYATHRVSKISMDAVRDGRFVWTNYGFKPEKVMVTPLHTAMRRTYRKLSGKEIPGYVELPKNGPTILYYRYGGFNLGFKTLEGMNEIVLTLNLRSAVVRACSGPGVS